MAWALAFWFAELVSGFLGSVVFVVKGLFALLVGCGDGVFRGVVGIVFALCLSARGVFG